MFVVDFFIVRLAPPKRIERRTCSPFNGGGLISPLIVGGGPFNF
jgi:hypothetical protein